MRDPRKSRDVRWDDFSTIRSTSSTIPSVRVVVECIGGLGLARELILRAIARGKDVVTANKDLIATEGPWLAAFAARTGASLRYEAAVGGAIPIVRALAVRWPAKTCSRSAACSTARPISCSTRWRPARSTREALAEAQRLGFRRSGSAQRRRRARRRAQARDPRRARVPPAVASRRRWRGAASAGSRATTCVPGAERGLRAKLRRGRAPRVGRMRDRGGRDAGVRSGGSSVRAAARRGERRARARARLRAAGRSRAPAPAATRPRRRSSPTCWRRSTRASACSAHDGEDLVARPLRAPRARALRGRQRRDDATPSRSTTLEAAAGGVRRARRGALGDPGLARRR